MAKKIEPVYDESKIKTLSSLEHIRLRTGMYIGRTGDGSHYDDGVYILLKEVIDNAIDEFIMGYGKQVDITVEDGVVSVRDYGRGIPHGKLVDCVSTINTGAKYNDEVFQFSVGLNGVGTKAVNALAASFTVRSYRDGAFAEAVFERGALIAENSGKAPREPNGTFVNFLPDEEIFGDFEFRAEHVIRRLKLYTYLNAGLTLRYNGQSFVSQGGLLDLVREETEEEAVYEPLHYRSKMLEIAFTHCQRFSETHFSFVNGQFTSDGGTHLSAFREGMLKAVNEFSKKKFEGDDVREGMVGAVAIRLKDPIFESQTKNKLGNAEIRSDLVNQVKDAVLDLLHRNADVAEKLLLKVQDTERLRKELQTVKKMARERAKAISLRIPQLKDCKIHYDLRRNKGHESMIFITEGQSAAGSIVSCRDVNTQAIYTLKGKPLNVCDLKREAIYKNDELYNLMRGLNIEDSVDALRYQRIILATDADVDGLHIRNLMITFFLRFFEPLVLRQHLFILETPLFRVRTKKETIYCYSEKERDAAMKKLGKGSEVTRFKGLGEISPHEFKQFIGQDMRLSPVEVDNTHVVNDVLDFYMGKNTPERRGYIMDYLVVDVAV
ncbi:MAG TPA: toprim domain-containing protein [Kiritimatiellia bacterium]|nr:toprim domain-containing protein [Kiritimatiellia bacterium]HMP00163.1 toprim domain-containing protein [Kiritimatiellia bacterium]